MTRVRYHHEDVNPVRADGRVDQKRRTRDALIAAARDLVANGATPTVEGAAEAASISRTTAYRYFSNQRALLVAAHPETAATSLLPDDAPDDAATRLDLVIDAFTRSTVENEAQQRTMLRLSLEADPVERSQLPLRQGRGIKWIEEALAPLRDQMSEGRGSPPHPRDTKRNRNRSARVADRRRRTVTRRRNRTHAMVGSRPAPVGARRPDEHDAVTSAMHRRKQLHRSSTWSVAPRKCGTA